MGHTLQSITAPMLLFRGTPETLATLQTVACLTVLGLFFVLFGVLFCFVVVVVSGQLAGSQFPDQGLNLGHNRESPES